MIKISADWFSVPALWYSALLFDARFGLILLDGRRLLTM